MVPAGLNLLAVITPFSLSSLPFYFELIIFFLSFLVVAAQVSPWFFDADTFHSDFGEDLVEVMRNEIENKKRRDLNYNELITEIAGAVSEGNIIISGEAGIGKTALVEELAYKIARGDCDEEYPNLKDVKIIKLSHIDFNSGTKYLGETERKIQNILKYVQQNNVILFVDEIHMLVSNGDRMDHGPRSVSEMLKPYLDGSKSFKNKIRIIGATDKFEDMQNDDGAFTSRFSKINMEKPDKQTTCKILKSLGYTNTVALEAFEKVVGSPENNPRKTVKYLGLVGRFAKKNAPSLVTSDDLEKFSKSKIAQSYNDNKSNLDCHNFYT
ncbi:MAG: AAA family ATPase [Legionellales bacterium]|nr:AAA family ATPase [Legionellales bacterium]